MLTVDAFSKPKLYLLKQNIKLIQTFTQSMNLNIKTSNKLNKK